MVDGNVEREPAGPLDGLVAAQGFGIAVGPRMAAVDLKGDAADPGFASAVEGVLGARLPVAANTTAVAGRGTVLWLGPQNWLVRCAAADGPPLLAALQGALAGAHGTATDVSHGVQLIAVSGPHARGLLARATPLDLDARRFPVGACAHTRFGRVPVRILALDVVPTFHLQARRSHARYVWDFLVAAAPHTILEEAGG